MHTVSAYDMHLHAATTVDGRDRRRLERVCRYLLRPPFAHDAIEALADGRVRVHFKAPSRRGAAFADMSVDNLLKRLAHPVESPRVVSASASTSARVPGALPKFPDETS